MLNLLTVMQIILTSLQGLELFLSTVKCLRKQKKLNKLVIFQKKYKVSQNRLILFG